MEKGLLYDMPSNTLLHFVSAIIEDTVKCFKEFNPQLIVPGHCTGWRACDRFVRELDGHVVPMAVGMSFKL